MTPRPLILAWDNFTPPARTPWGGRAIAERWKAALPLTPEQRAAAIGESWELSVDPALPSRIAAPEALAGHFLADVLAADPVAWLGAAGRQGARGTPLLLKLLDAADTLSVQVHPRDDDPHLAPHESGKPEGWYILDAAPGAGIWLGLADGVTRPAFEAALDAGADLAPLLHFVPASPGDAFVIGPGTVHAIGAGVTLLEPQLVVPGKSGVTYRLWDWNRRYDALGRPDPDGPTGLPRPLHRAPAVAATAWDAPRGAVFAARQRYLSRPLDVQDHARRDEVLAFDGLTLERWSGSGPLSIPAFDALVGAFVARGVVSIASDIDTVNIRVGQTVVFPAAGLPVTLTLADAEVYAARVG